MTNPDSGPEFLRIEDAARLLRVNPRTIYRRITNGDLPASKVGGLYLIRRVDLDGFVEQGRVSSPLADSAENVLQPMKCGACFRILRSDEQIGEACLEPGCDRLLCTQCLAEGIQHCAQHSPSRDQKLQRAQTDYDQGLIPVLVKDSTARLRELNFLNRLQARLSQINSLIHPVSGEAVTISNWDDLLESQDERAEVMRLLNKVVLDSTTLARTPLNAGLRYRIPAPKNQKSLPIEIVIQVFSRLPVMLRDGFDTLPLSEEIVTPYLLRTSEEAQRTQTFRLVLLASTTGWAPDALQIVQGGGDSLAFAHRLVLFYLFDIGKGELAYNRRDDRARRYTELFAPLLPSEELEEVVKLIEKQFLVYGSLTLQYATETLPYPQNLIRQAFDRLAASGGYTLTEVPNLGVALVRA